MNQEPAVALALGEVRDGHQGELLQAFRPPSFLATGFGKAALEEAQIDYDGGETVIDRAVVDLAVKDAGLRVSSSSDSASRSSNSRSSFRTSQA